MNDDHDRWGGGLIEPAGGAPSPSTVIGHRPELLLVEDSDEDYEALQRALSRGRPDIEMTRVADGTAALERLLDGALPDLVVLDLNLPGVDGREVLERVRERHPAEELPVLVLTTSTRTVDVERCFAAGANGYLYKSLSYQLLEASLRGAVDYWLPRGPQED